jgi:hypothetical protein
MSPKSLDFHFVGRQWGFGLLVGGAASSARTKQLLAQRSRSLGVKKLTLPTVEFHPYSRKTV